MKLIEANINGTEMYRLDDGRLGKIYPSGYVRVTILNHGIKNGKYFHRNSTKNSRWYQINKVEKYKDDKYQSWNFHRRILIPKRSDRLSLLQAFNDKNCDKMTHKIKMLESYIKHLLWSIDYSKTRNAEENALKQINLEDKINEIKYIINRK
tara:strand:- start:141 stop:596 length:456 start_codon:yes stop_codon:yes gene_type:complete